MSVREAEIFTQALAVPVGTRAAFIAEACGGDDALRRRVEALLQSHEEVGDFLEEAPDKAVRDARGAATADTPPLRIGRYKLLQQIGEGGCGVVFMAQQEEPVRRRVALKIIKPGMDTRSVIARFEAERQALALMDHPSIAKVFDAGATESGRPYFVMELVRGVKITEYCDEHSLTTEERLKLFIQVCAAIQHAHQKGIIHRDIKPSNILVTMTSEGVALPVVIDFGIPKPTTNQWLTDKTLFTAFEMFIGTPAYISPEQAALTSVDVDTRTDVYSLGVLLYELLTGSKPFDTTELLKEGIDAIRKVIREQEPVRPSTQLSKLRGVELTTVAQRRKCDPPRLIRTISGDLDWIVMKALEKDRARRYETANGLALDVSRFLDHEAVLARPPSRLYRFRKSVQRNRLLFLGIGIVATLLIASLIVLTTLLAGERQARQQSQQVTEILEAMFDGARPAKARGRSTEMLRDILDRTAQRVASEVSNQPAVQAKLCHLIARAYLDISVYKQAEVMARLALDKERELYGPRSPQAAESLYLLGMALVSGAELPEAEKALQESLLIRQEILNPTHAAVAASLDGLGSVYIDQRRLKEATPLIRRALEIRRQSIPRNPLAVAESLQSLCRLLEAEQRWPEAEVAAREFLETCQQIPGREDLVAEALDDLAMAAGFNGKPDVQEKSNKEAFAIKQTLLPEDHPYLVKSMANLGEILRLRGNSIEAHGVLAGVVSIQRKLLGEAHYDTLASLGSFGQLLATEDKWEEAESVHREALRIWRQKVGDRHPHTLWAWGQVCHVLVSQGKYPEAEQLLAEILTPSFAKDPACSELLGRRLDLMGRQGRWKEAIHDAAILMQYQPSEYYWPYTLAALLATLQDRAGYQLLCRKLPGPFSETSDPYVAQRIADSCLLLPNSGADMQSAAVLANRAVALGDNHGDAGYFHACKALSEYRAGHFSDAVTWADKSVKSPEACVRAQGSAILAMAQWRLGFKEAARAALSEGTRLIPDAETRRDISSENNWLNWLVARTELDEARVLIQPSLPGAEQSLRQ